MLNEKMSSLERKEYVTKIHEELNNRPLFRLYPSKICSGVGAFALAPIPKDTLLFSPRRLVFIKWDDIDVNDNVFDAIRELCHYNDWGFWIDDTFNNINVAYYVNHSETPNCRYDADKDSFYSIQQIEAGEELTCAYPKNEQDW